MRYLCFAWGLVLLVACGCGESEEIKGVRAAFDGYIESILDKRGEEALAHVNRATVEYYGDMLQKALTAKREEVQNLRITDKVSVLMLRHMVPLEVLESLTPEKTLVYAVDQGLIGEDSVMDLAIGEVTVSGTRAKAEMLVKDKKTPLFILFDREEERWKIDLTHMMQWGDLAFQQLVRDSGLGEDELVFRILETLAGRKVPESIWDPLVK